MNLLSSYLRKYRSEINHVVVSTIIALVGGILYRFLTAARIVDVVLLSLLAALLLLIVGLKFSIKRHLTWKIENMEEIITEAYGTAHQQGQFTHRRSHWPEEKEILSASIVKDHLPELLERLDTSQMKTAAVIIDSGTTLRPLFPKLRSYGLTTKREERPHIFTNSLAGIDAFNREVRLAREEYAIRETEIHLFGGNPLERYRATTGDETLSALRNVKDNSAKLLGVITANWIVMGAHFNSLTICAKGRGHPQFKKMVIDICDLVLVVAPLAKLLRLDSVDDLNELLKDSGEGLYEGVEVAKPSPEQVILLTTVRAKPHSFLYRHSRQLLELQAKGVPHNYVLAGKLPRYDPHTRGQIETEVPHEYLRPYVEKIYTL